MPPGPRPAGTPVSNALDNKAVGKTAKAVKAAIEAIDATHGDGQLPRIPVKQTASSKRNGAFAYNPLTGRPIEIEVSRKGDHPRMTAAHEIGHFLENAGIPGGTPAPRAFTLSPEMKDWLAAIRNSDAVKSLESFRSQGTGSVTITNPSGRVVPYKLDPKHLDYLLQPKELWARSYAQYIATKAANNDPEWANELNGLRDPSHGPYAHRHWSDSDFAPIARSIDDLFAKLGWIQ